MRAVVLLAVCAALSPARAQVHVAPAVGFDIDYDAPMVGIGVDVGLPICGIPVALAVGAAYEHVFMPEVDSPRDYDRGRLMLIGRLEQSRLPVIPYVWLGVDAERSPAVLSDGTEYPTSLDWGASAGLGVEVRGVFVEGTVGSNRYISQGRVAFGYRF